MTKIAIIGAGLSGLTAAHFLHNSAAVTVFEKARGVGGRMSTRRAKPYYFDHGAQYFTARTKPFQNFIQPLIVQGIIEPWHARYARFDGKVIITRKNLIDEEHRYVGSPGMNKLSKYLASQRDVHLNKRIIALEKKGKWGLTDHDGNVYGDFDWVISAIPSPQAVALLPPSFKYHAEIKKIKMQPCFSLMLGFEKVLPLEFDAAHVKNSDVSWIAVNRHKPGREGLYTLIVQSSEKYAADHLEDDHDAILSHLMIETSRIIGHDVSDAAHKTVHRWRYALNEKKENNPVFIDENKNLAVCGDWCVGGRVEGAFTSVYNLVNEMKKKGL